MASLLKAKAFQPFFPLNEGESFFGTEYTDYSLLKYSSQLALLLLVQIICFSVVLDRLNGRLSHMMPFFHNLQFEIFGPTKPLAVTIYLQTVAGSILVMPAATIIIWTAFLFNQRQPRAAVSVLLLGSSLLLATYGLLKIKWNNWRFKASHRAILLVAYLLFTGWQFAIVFSDREQNTYTGLSGIFLTQNGVCATLLIYINIRANQFTMKTLLDKFLDKNSNHEHDPNRDLTQEIQAQHKDDQYIPSFEDVFEFISIGKISTNKQNSALGAGIHTYFSRQPKICSVAFNLTLLSLYGGLFVAYALIDYTTNEKSLLGVTTSITVLIVDIFILIMFMAKIVQQPAFLAFILFAARILIFSFGSTGWIYGYMVSYILISVVISHSIVGKHFPFSLNFNSIDIMKLKPKKRSFLDLSKYPEVLLVVISILLVATVAITTTFAPKGVIISDFEITYNNQKVKISAMLTAFGSILVVITEMVLNIAYRTYTRKLNKVRDIRHWYLFCVQFDVSYISLTGVYLVVIAWVVLCYSKFKSKVFLTWGLFLPAILLCLLYQFIKFVQNDYEWLENIDTLNKRNKQHNSELAQTKLRAMKIKNEILAGNSTILEPNLMQLVKNVIEEEQRDQQLLQQVAALNAEKEEADSPTVFGQEPVNKTQFEASGNLLIQSQMALNDDEIDLDQIRGDSPSDYVQKLMTSRVKLIPDWREEGLSPLTAFISRKCRPNDYKIFFAVLAAHVLLVGFAIAIGFESHSTGAAMAFGLWHVMLLLLALQGELGADRASSHVEKFVLFFAYVEHYASAIAILFISWPSKDLKNIKKVELLRHQLLYYLILLPLLTSLVCFTLKYFHDAKVKRFTKTCYVLFGLVIANLITFIVCVFIYESVLLASIIIACALTLIYLGVQFAVFNVNNFRLHQAWYFSNSLLFLAISLGLLIALGKQDDITNFAATTIMLIFIESVIIVFGAFLAYQNSYTSLENPIFVSSFVMPVYKYYSSQNDVKPYYWGLILTMMLLIVSFTWALLTTFMVKPANFGISIGCIVECIMFVAIMWSNTFSTKNLREIKGCVDKDIVKQAWLQTKKNLINTLHLSSRNDYVSYEDWWKRRFHLKNYIRGKKGKPLLDLPQNGQVQLEKTHEEGSDVQAHILASLKSWVDLSECDLDNIHNCLGLLYEVDKECRTAYKIEYEIIIQFQLIIEQLANTLKLQKQKWLMKFIAEKRAELFVMGIALEVPKGGSLDQRFSAIVQQIQSLAPQNQTLFNLLKDQYNQELREKELIAVYRDQEQNKNEQERKRSLNEKQEARRQKMLKVDQITEIDEMPDCPRKYHMICEKVRNQPGYMFEDAEFSHTNEADILGAKIMAHPNKNFVMGWKRASEIEGAVLFQDGADCRDIVQGNLGDCYLLSAFSVIGNTAIQELFDPVSRAEEAWRKTGCFMIRFANTSVNDGEETVIIIDDWLPIDQNGNPNFASGGENGLELWPAILEKAYAKLYGSYSAIVGGKVHVALADLTDQGYPEQIVLSEFKNNVSQFSAQLEKIIKTTSLIGAGSPDNPNGDTAISPEGIVQSHAYAILEVKKYGQETLIKLRNPHGYRGAEWRGDWADESEQWTAPAKSALQYTPSQTVDGIFWMSAIDFLENFKMLYLCRTLSEKKGWTKATMEGQWQGTSASGFPGNMIKLSPQYGLRVTKPCSCFIQLQQPTVPNSTWEGKNKIAFMVSREQGGKITKISRENIVGKGGISNLAVINAMIEFDNTVSYPYNYSILCASAKAGVEGEGTFTLTVFAQDKAMTLKEL